MKYKTKKRSILTISILLISIISFYSLKSYNQYNSFVTNLKNTLNTEEFQSAETLLSNRPHNIICKFKLDSAINTVLVDYINNLNNNFAQGAVSEDTFKNSIISLEKFNINLSEINNIKNNMPALIQSKNNYTEAVALFDSKKYLDAFKLFDSVDSISPSYSSASDYKNDCINLIKEDTLDKADELIQNDRFSIAIDLLSSSKDVLTDDSDILAKIDEAQSLKKDYLAKHHSDNSDNSDNSAKQANSKYVNFSLNAINNFDIASKTPRLIVTSLSEQKTYVFKGSKNNWNLEKEFVCSTGIKGKETPIGTFAVENKAPWFFSEKYGQGGKYWVGFKGNYLFHSVPFDRNQKKVLDDTLGKPSSHGCIRLSVEDSKWLFDNSPIGTKVIIY